MTATIIRQLGDKKKNAENYSSDSLTFEREGQRGWQEQQQRISREYVKRFGCLSFLFRPHQTKKPYPSFILGSISYHTQAQVSTQVTSYLLTCVAVTRQCITEILKLLLLILPPPPLPLSHTGVDSKTAAFPKASHTKGCHFQSHVTIVRFHRYQGKKMQSQTQPTTVCVPLRPTKTYQHRHGKNKTATQTRAVAKLLSVAVLRLLVCSRIVRQLTDPPTTFAAFAIIYSTEAPQVAGVPVTP